MSTEMLQSLCEVKMPWAEVYPKEQVLNYKKFMICKAVTNDAEGRPEKSSPTSVFAGAQRYSTKMRPRMSPTPEIDEMWRAHLLRPKSYAALMTVLLKDSEFSMIDYFPEAEGDSEAEKAARLRETGRIWLMLYGEELAFSSSPGIPPVIDPEGTFVLDKSASASASGSAAAEASNPEASAAVNHKSITKILYFEPKPASASCAEVPDPKDRVIHVTTAATSRTDTMRTTEAGNGAALSAEPTAGVVYEMHFTTYHGVSSFMVKQELSMHIGLDLKHLQLTLVSGGILYCSDMVPSGVEQLRLELTPQGAISKASNSEEPPEGTMDLYVKTLTGKTAAFHAKASDTVEYFKCLVFEREGTPPPKQNLIYAGQQLDEKKLLSEYNIQKGSTLHLVLGLRGR